mmetsp:Transcript_3766/g.5140  ORF Transcript_3766/g.5140 Transcript_3766/m.5140 type:complete len:115 (+) Transcript_3766:5335-5679(+)
MQQTEDEKAPLVVKGVPRLKEDIEMLLKLTESREPPKIQVRPTNIKVIYMMGDASGQGFGSSMWESTNDTLEVMQGRWMQDVAIVRSSNFCELHNLILSIECFLEEGKVEKGCE